MYTGSVNKSFCLVLLVTFFATTTICKKESSFQFDHSVTEENSVVENGAVYYIQSALNDLALSAEFEGRMQPAPTVLSTWEGLPSQLWEVYKIDEAFTLTPIENDFNSVTSFLKDNAHGYNVWHLEKCTEQCGLQFQEQDYYLMRNSKSLCLESHQANNPVTITTCNISSPSQYWKFHKLNL